MEMVQTKISPNSNDQLAKQTTLARTGQDNMGWTQARNFQIKKTFNAEDENERGSNQQKQLDKLKNISISIYIFYY